MVPMNPARTPTRARAPVILGALLATALLAVAAPLAVAQPDADSPRRDRPRDLERFEITLAGTATTKDNVTYEVLIEGHGAGKLIERDDAREGFHGRAVLNVTLTDADGNVVKEGRIRAIFIAHETDEGWKWHLVSLRFAFGGQGLGLRGSAEPGEDGIATLEGHGKSIVKLAEDQRRSVLDLDVSGEATKA